MWGCPGFTRLLCWISNRGGVAVQEKGTVSGPWTGLGSEIPAVHEWAGLCSWPCLSSWPGSREAQAGELREKSQGLSRLLGWPLGSWGLFSVASKVKEPYILPRASVALLLSHMGDCLRRRDAPEHPGYHFIDTKLFSGKPKPGFPEHQSSFDPLQNILAGSFRVRRGPIIPEFPSSKEPRKSPSTLSPHPRLSVAVTVLSYLRY